jgi:dipeptidyl aminopeptidase/acylaminoacyl peptidase
VWRKVIFLSLCASVATAAILAVWYYRCLPSQRGTATLFVEEGQVSVSHGYGTLAAPVPQVSEVVSGDEIRTGAGSRAHLMVSPAVSVILESESVVRLTRGSTQADGEQVVAVEVQSGRTWHEVQSPLHPGEGYEVLTSAALARLSPGRYLCEVSADGVTVIEVSEGVATVAAENTKVEVRSGEYTSMGVGQAPSVPRAVRGRVLFVSERSGSADIWVLDEEGRESQLTDNAADDLAPVWSPDGTRIAFVSLRNGNSEIYVMDADGSNQVNLTRNAADDYAPSWSPDGGLIAFESLRDGVRDLYVMRSDGTEQDRLTFGPGLSVAPQWAVERSEIVFSRIEDDSNGDGVVDARDMGAFFYIGLEGGTPQAFWDTRFVFDEMVLPWARRAVG